MKLSNLYLTRLYLDGEVLSYEPTFDKIEEFGSSSSLLESNRNIFSIHLNPKNFNLNISDPVFIYDAIEIRTIDTNTEVVLSKLENDKFDENVDTTDVDKILSIDLIFDQNEDIPEKKFEYVPL